MEAKYALGPWSLQDWTSYDQDGAIEACGSQVVDANGCMISAGFIEGASEEEEASVRLIAAAPDLLEALQAIMPDAVGNHIGGPDTQARIDAARAAIAKAIGSAA